MLPNFWKKTNLTSITMLPASLVYFAGALLRNALSKPYRAGIPVICVGNVTVGGAGKTPVTLDITQILTAAGKKVAIASRGYKGEIKTATRVDKMRHTVNSVGDEPLLLAEIAPTYIAANRSQAIKMAEQNHSDIIIMDDGLQNPTVAKDLSLLVIDGKFGIGNGLMIPSGPLREPLGMAAAKSDAVIIIGNDETGVLQKLPAGFNKPVIRAHFAPHGTLPDKSIPYIAFAGIGNPDKFFATLVQNGYNIIESVPFPDHHNYSDKEISNLIHKAENKGAGLITTEKDAVRLPSFGKKKIQILPIRIVWDDSTQIKNLLSKVLQK